ncbi:MAG: KGG domain-containing protein [bacterium]|nr:KGG domain-containing protein [bacterium]
MANNENLIPFNKRSEREAREFGRKGGKASGEARRRKADFRRTLNLLLTTEIDSPEWTPILESMGLDSTLEAAVNAAMIKEALSGNVKAYIAIRDTLGQTTKSEEDLEEQRVRTAAAKAKSGQNDAEEEQDDGFLDALKGTAASDWKEEVSPDEEETDI